MDDELMNWFMDDELNKGKIKFTEKPVNKTSSY